MGMNRGLVMIQGVVRYGDTAPKSLFSLPSGAIPLYAVVQTEVAFNDSGTDTLNLGIDQDDDYLAAGVSLASVGGQMVVFNQSPEFGRQVGVIGRYVGQNGDATAGRAVVNLVFATPFEPR